MKNKKGKFIVVDGIRGSGKTTLIKNLKAKLSSESFVFTREPGGSPLAEKLRTVILSEEARGADIAVDFLMITAARIDHVQKLIAPAIKSGANVICDRFDSSTYAIQIYERGYPVLKDWFFEARRFYAFNAPDLYIYLNVDLDVAEKRYKARPDISHHFHDQPRWFYERMAKGYQDFYERMAKGYQDSLPCIPCEIIDANQSADAVEKQCLEIISILVK
ncbi:MAG: dTMP kinase [Candidatus Paceibacterota bacterium]